MTRPPPVEPRYPDEGDDLYDPEAGEWIPRQSHLPALFTGVLYGLLLGIVVGILFATHLPVFG